MSRHAFDKGSKWMVSHQGKGILFLGGVREVRCRAVQPEVVQPRQLPDGLLEVYARGQKQPDYVVVEVATYPERRVAEQALDDLMLVYQDRRVLPDLLILVLRPKGRLRVEKELEVRGRRGLSRLAAEWKVVELWNVPATDLLAAGDVGLIPWAPLAQFDDPPEALLRQCRERIEQQADEKERANLLAVTQVFSRLRFPARRFQEILGGKKVMNESPLIQELMAEKLQDAILRILKARFGDVPSDLVEYLRAVTREKKLNALIDKAAVCRNLEAFRTFLLTQ